MSFRVLICHGLCATVLGFGMASLDITPAHADGTIGGAIGGEFGKSLDQWNKNLGRPTERAGAAVLDRYYPGAGRAALQAQRMQDDNWGMPRESSGGSSGSGGGPTRFEPSSGSIISPGDEYTCRQGAVSTICSRR